MREPERRADADELADADAEVRDQHRDRRERRPAHAVLLADQLGEALAGDGAHPRRHLLDDDQADGDHHHHPQQVVAVLRPDRRVGRDPARVVAGVGRDQARADEGEDEEEPGGEPVTRAQPRTAAQGAARSPPAVPILGGTSTADSSKIVIAAATPLSVVAEHTEVAPPAAWQDELEHVVDRDHAEKLLVRSTTGTTVRS